MDAATAEARLKRLVAWTATPALSQGDIDDLLLQAKRADAYSRAPSDPDWVPTWDLNFAAWKGWEQKANDCANAYNVIIDQKSLSRDQLFQHCESRAKEYRRKVQQTPAMLNVTSRYR